MMYPSEVTSLASDVVERLSSAGGVLAAAESCTGGLVAGAITAIPGSSTVFDRGWVTYANAAKVEALGVAESLITQHGAVSQEVAGAMAAGALARSGASIAISTTGIAGPGGGSGEKPVGLVWFGMAQADGRRRTTSQVFQGLDRDGVRLASVGFALRWLLESVTR